MTSLRWVWQSVKSVRARILTACLLGVLRIGLGLTFIWVSKLLVDKATHAQSVSSLSLMQLSILLGALMIGEMIVQLIVNYISVQTEIKYKNHLRTLLYDRLLSVRHDRISETHSADYVGRLTEDTRVLADAVTRKLPDCVVLLVQFAGAFAMLFLMSSQLALCVVGILPFFIILSKVYVMRTRRLTAEVRKADSVIQTSIQEGLQHHAVVQTLECEPRMSQRLDSQQRQLYQWTMVRTRFGVFSRAMLRTGFIACYLTAFLWSVWHLHTGVITYGTMTAFLQLVARIQNPMSSLSQIVPAMVHALTSIDRLYELRLLPVDIKSDGCRFEGAVGIRLEDVSFAYKEGNPMIFDGFTYDFTPGSKTVIMGETGVGKTTLVRMLMALLHPSSGQITMYDAKGERMVDPSTRSNIVYVPQGNSLFEGTVRDNLLLAAPEATDSEMAAALDTAVANFVYDLPQGLDTRCGELGASLSEGQAQRIAIARALLRKGSVLILDEFNSALDSTTAATLIERLTARRADSTIIFISHRKEVADYCDNILRLE